jgi:hypothetical protein
MPKTVSFFAFAVILSSAILSCHRGPQRAKIETTLFTYAQTACFGNCPVYGVQVFANGRLELEGEAFMDKIGTYSLRLTSKEMKDLKKVFGQMGFCGLEELYGLGVADLPSIVVVADCAGTEKRLEAILDYPQEVQAFAQHMRALVARADWEAVKPVNID